MSRARFCLARWTTLTALALVAACGGGGGSAATSVPAVDVSPVAVRNTASALAAGWSKGVFMEIHVRAFKDSDGDGIGDLRGLIQQLDYLKDLGITGIWLMPITDSQDHDHGYAVQNYRGMEPAYGQLADFDELLAQAHARGIGVIIDYVINHSAAENPLFLNARSAKANAYRDWYVWSDVAPAGWSIYGRSPWYGTSNGAYFAGFWDQMPDFNLRNPSALAYHQDNLRFWLNRGVDGFRFDAVGNLIENGPQAWENQPENDDVMHSLRQVVMGYDQRYMVCEAPAAPQSYADATSCGSSFAFAHQANIVGAADGDASAVNDVAQYFTTAPAGMATFVSNHDSFAGDRLWDQLNGNVSKYRLAAATYLLQPGPAFIYYGEEIGMSGGQGLSGDPRLRTPMSWSANTSHAGFTTGTPFRALSANVATQNVAAQQTDPNSLLSFYKAVIALRQSRPSLVSGAYGAPMVNGTVMSFVRTQGREKTLVVFNYGTGAANASPLGLPASASLQRLWPVGSANAVSDGSGQALISLPAQSFAVFSVN